MSEYTGSISEFCDPFMHIRIYAPSDPTQPVYCLRLKDTDRRNVIQLLCKDHNYRATREQAIQHIFDAIEMATLSHYKMPHYLEIYVPMYPNVYIPIQDTAKDNVKDLLKRAIQNFF